jgi:iron complex outermembrane recepter protein
MSLSHSLSTRLLAVALLLTAHASSAHAAADGQVMGVVVDTTGTPIAGATVDVQDRGGRFRQTVTGADGRFVIVDLAPGPARLAVSGLGWDAVSIVATVPSEREGVRIVLKPAGLEETVVVIGATSAVRGLHPASQDLIGSVDVIGGDQLERENVDLSYELLKRVPGVYVSDYNQGVVAGGIGIRGFNTEGDTMHVKLLVDGIPANLNSGVADINAIFPLDIDRVELVKGTNDPRNGLFNIAGTMQVFTSPPGRYLKVKTLAGAFGTQDVQGTGAFSTGRLSHVYFGGYRTSDGYRDHSDLDRYAFAGKWRYTPAADRWTLGVTARSHDFDTQAPGYLTLAQSRLTPQFSPAFSATDGGEQHTRHVSANFDRLFGTVALSVKGYRQTFATQRWVRFTEPSAQQERLEDETQTGALATVTWRPGALAARDGVVSFGADVQSQDNIAQRYRTIDRVRGPLLRDQAFDFANGGAYAMTDLRPVRWLRVNGGLRADRVGGDFTNVITGARLPILDYGTIWQPKVGVLAVVREGVNVYGNAGRSFQVGVGSAAYGTAPLTYSKNDGWEAGVRLAPVRSLAARVGIWGQDASDELRLKFDNSGDSENVGRTRRRGWNVEVTARPHQRVYAWASYTRQKATLAEPGAATPELRGHELNHVPHYTAKWGVDVTASSIVSVAAWTEAQGDYFLTTRNAEGRFGGRRLTSVDVFVRPHRAVSIGGHVKNLTSAYHEYAWYDGTQTLHSPGERRAVSVTTTVEF